MGRRSKIDRYKIGPDILEDVGKGITYAAICKKHKKQGIHLKPQNITGYMKRVRRVTGQEMQTNKKAGEKILESTWNILAEYDIMIKMMKKIVEMLDRLAVPTPIKLNYIYGLQKALRDYVEFRNGVFGTSAPTKILVQQQINIEHRLQEAWAEINEENLKAKKGKQERKLKEFA